MIIETLDAGPLSQQTPGVRSIRSVSTDMSNPSSVDWLPDTMDENGHPQCPLIVTVGEQRTLC
jgi:hypothetical protein